MLLAPTYPEIDSERDVVLEEIAMYEDEPQDRVHDILADAVFGEHPLGRRVLGEAEVIASIPVPDIAAYHQRPLHRRQRRRRRRRPPRPRPDRRARRAARLAGRRRGAAGSTGAGRTRRRPAPLLPEGHRAVPHLLRGARDRPRGRAPLRARRPRLDLRRLDLLAAVPRGPREARPRLLGRLLQRAVHRHRPGRHLRRHPRGQRRGGLRDHRRRARRGCAPSRSPPRSWRAAKESVKGRLVLSSESTAARMTRISRATLFGLPIDSLDEMLAKVDAVDGRRPDRARRRALRRRAALRRLHRLRRGLLPRGAAPVSEHALARRRR